MAVKIEELTRDVLNLIFIRKMTYKELSDLFSEKYGHKYYFTHDFTFKDLIDTEIIYKTIKMDENNCLELTSKGIEISIPHRR